MREALSSCLSCDKHGYLYNCRKYLSTPQNKAKIVLKKIFQKTSNQRIRTTFTKVKILEGKKVYSVSEVNYFAKQNLEQMVFWVEGEVSSVKKNPNWNFYYLDLKDQRAILPCILDGYLLKDFEDEVIGQKLLIYGYLSIYEPTGRYQLRIQSIQKLGVGYIQKQLEELIKKLKSEGLFDERHKKLIPIYPKRVCVVTSYGSDAWQDFKTHTQDKFPIIELYSADVRVQGPRSASQLAKILPIVDRGRYDVVVITRGGGSLEDLAAFSDEIVARTIFSMKTPTVVAIGHEANESLAEWVADRRASTPTDAANIVAAGYLGLLSNLQNFKKSLKSFANYYFSVNFQKLDYLHFSLNQLKISFKDLPHRLTTVRESLRRHEKILISDAHKQIQAIYQQLKKGITTSIKNQTQRLAELEHALSLLTPQNTLERGYSITTDKDGKILRSVNPVVVNDIIGVKLFDGSLTSKVLGKRRK